MFRINVRNGDEISKLNQLVNSDNFKVHGSFQSPWVSANFGGKTLAYWRYLSRVFVCNPVLVNMPFLFFFSYFFSVGERVVGKEVLYIIAVLFWETGSLSSELHLSLCC